MSDDLDLDEVLRVANPVPPGGAVLGQRVALVSAQARAAVEQDQRRARHRRTVVVGATATVVLSVGAVAAAAGEGVTSWQWFDRPDAQASITLPSGKVCDYRLMAWPEDGEVRHDDDPMIAAASAALARIELDEVDVSEALARQYEHFDVLAPGVPKPDPTYPPGTNPNALGDPGPQPMTADEAYMNALGETVGGLVRSELRSQGITAPYSSEGVLDCTGGAP